MAGGDSKAQPKPKSSPRSQSLHDITNSNLKKPAGAAASEDSKVPSSKPPEQKKPSPTYLGKPGEIYELLKTEYQKRRGISFTIGGIHVDPKMAAADVEARKKEETARRAAVLLDFWKQYFVGKRLGKSTSKVLNETKKSESLVNSTIKTLKEQLKTYSEEDLKFTLEQDILKEMNDSMSQAEKSKVQAKVLEEHAKLEEEKRVFQKALNLFYSFERESAADKEYMQTLVWAYREIKQKFPQTGTELYEWWKAYEKKEERKINKPEEYTKSLVEGFYSDKAKISRLEQLYKGVNKYFPKQAKDLIKYWKTIKVSTFFFSFFLPNPNSQKKC